MSNSFVHQPLETPHFGAVELQMSFRPDTATDPSIFRGAALLSVAHTSTGVWTLTLKEDFRTWQGLYSGHLTVQLNAAADFTLQFGAIDLSAGTVVVRAQIAAVLTDIASNANNWIHVTLNVKESTAADGSGFNA